MASDKRIGKPSAHEPLRRASTDAGTLNPDGFLRATSRWVVEHSGLTALLTVLVVGALCVGQWWVSYRPAQDWSARHPGQPVPFALFDGIGWWLVLSAAAWLWLWYLSSQENEAPSTSDGADWWRFSRRERR